MTFIIGRGFAERQILKKCIWPYLLNWVEYCDEILHTHRYIDKISPWDCQMTFGIGRGFAEVQSLKKKWKLTIKPFGIFW